MTPEVGKTYWVMEEERAISGECIRYNEISGDAVLATRELGNYVCGAEGLYDSAPACYAAAIQRLQAKLKAELAKERGE